MLNVILYFKPEICYMYKNPKEGEICDRFVLYTFRLLVCKKEKNVFFFGCFPDKLAGSWNSSDLHNLSKSLTAFRAFVSLIDSESRSWVSCEWKAFRCIDFPFSLKIGRSSVKYVSQSSTTSSVSQQSRRAPEK